MTEPTTSTCTSCGAELPVNVDGTLRKHRHDGQPCPGGGQLVGAARIPKPHHGYYTDKTTGAKLRRVTSILENGTAGGKERIIHWAGNTVAASAMQHLPALVRASRRPDTRAQAYDWLRRAHTRAKDERADIGGAVHDLIEAHILGTPLPEQLLADPDMAPFLHNFERFAAEWRVVFEASEMVVANYDLQYAGKLDYLLRSPVLAALLDVPPETVFMGDTKTGGELDVTLDDGSPKGVYPEAALQMSGYRGCDIGWLRDGTKVPLPAIHDVGIVLHLRPEGYRVFPVRCGDDVFARFVGAIGMDVWQSIESKTVVGRPLEIPVSLLTPKVA